MPESTQSLRALLQRTLHEEIPLSRVIGIRVAEVTPDSVTLAAPLDANINHKCTVFGGSLYSVAVLTGWGLIYTRLQALALDAHIVIHDSSIKYNRPVSADFTACCRIDTDKAFARFLEAYRRRGRARITLKVTIPDARGEPAVVFLGRYVIHTRS